MHQVQSDKTFLIFFQKKCNECLNPWFLAAKGSARSLLVGNSPKYLLRDTHHCRKILLALYLTVLPGWAESPANDAPQWINRAWHTDEGLSDNTVTGIE